jgi:hypothetical protein
MSRGMVLRMYVSMHLSSCCESMSTMAIRLLKCLDNSLPSNGDGQTGVKDAKCIVKDGEYPGGRIGRGNVAKPDGQSGNDDKVEGVEEMNLHHEAVNQSTESEVGEEYHDNYDKRTLFASKSTARFGKVGGAEIINNEGSCDDE